MIFKLVVSVTSMITAVGVVNINHYLSEIVRRLPLK
jgi:hypothetical protein